MFSPTQVWTVERLSPWKVHYLWSLCFFIEFEWDFLLWGTTDWKLLHSKKANKFSNNKIFSQFRYICDSQDSHLPTSPSNAQPSPSQTQLAFVWIKLSFPQPSVLPAHFRGAWTQSGFRNFGWGKWCARSRKTTKNSKCPTAPFPFWQLGRLFNN